MPDDGPGVNLGNSHDVVPEQVPLEGLPGAPVGVHGAELACRKSLHKRLGRFLVLLVCAVVANMGIGHHDDLPGVRGIGKDFLVSGHGRIEHDLAGRFPYGAKSTALEGAAVFQCQNRFHFSGGFPTELKTTAVNPPAPRGIRASSERSPCRR